MSSFINTISYIGAYINMILSLLVVIFNENYYFNVNLNDEFVDSISQTWSSHSFYDVISSNNYFSNNTSQLNNYNYLLSNSSWPGIMKGCDCTKTKSFLNLFENNNFIFQRPCRTTNETIIGCNNIIEKSKIDYNVWRGKTLITKLNTVLDEKYNYYNYSNILKKNLYNYDLKVCIKNYKKCGILDSLGNVLCVPIQKECPINDIKIIKNIDKISTNKDNKIHYNNILYNFIELNNNNYLIFTNENVNGKIVISLKTSEYNICSNHLEVEQGQSYVLSNYSPHYCTDMLYYFSKDNLIANNNTYSQKMLDNNKKQSKNYLKYKYDYRYNIIDTYSKKNLYMDNNIDKVIQSIPKYDTYNYANKDSYYSKFKYSDTIKLYYTNYPGWKVKCLLNDKYNLSIFKLLKTKTNLNNNYLGYIKKILSIIMLIFSVIALVVIYITITHYNSIMHGINFVSQFSFIVASLLYSIVGFFSLSLNYNLKSNLKQVIYNECGDDITNASLNLIFDSIDVRLEKIILIISITSTLIFPFIFMISFYFIEDRKRHAFLNDSEMSSRNESEVNSNTE